MKRFSMLLALALAFVTFLPAAQAAGKVAITARMNLPVAGTRAWVTVYRSELGGAQRTIVASGWMDYQSFTAYNLYSADDYFVRAQVHHGTAVVADTTVSVTTHRNTTVTLHHSGGNHYFWTTS